MQIPTFRYYEYVVEFQRVFKLQLYKSLKGIIFYRDDDMAKTFSSTQEYVCESIFSFKRLNKQMQE